jgi:hypothetical protein
LFPFENSNFHFLKKEFNASSKFTEDVLNYLDYEKDKNFLKEKQAV